jgi:hypothetical protein
MTTRMADLIEVATSKAAEILSLVDEFAGAALPEAGDQPCTLCDGNGVKTYPATPDFPERSYPCRYCKDGRVLAPQVDLILQGMYTDRPHLKPRSGYGLSPRELVKRGANETTVRLYEYIRARWMFDLGRNYNIGGMIMNNLPKSHPFLPWAEALNAALLVLHGRRSSAGGDRWEQAGLRIR